MENSSVILGNTEMYYVSFGEGKKKLVVLPGLSDGLTTVKGKAWLLSLPYRKFFRDYTVYMFSRKNDMPEGYSMEDMAEDQVSAMRSLGIEQAYVLGVSQGGMIAQNIAIRHPEMVTRLILAVTAPNANDTVKTVISRWMELAEQGDHTALMTDTAERMYSERYLKKYRKALPHLARFTKPSGYDRFLKNASASEQVQRLSCIMGYPAASCMYTRGSGTGPLRKQRISTTGSWNSAINKTRGLFR